MLGVVFCLFAFFSFILFSFFLVLVFVFLFFVWFFLFFFNFFVFFLLNLRFFAFCHWYVLYMYSSRYGCFVLIVRLFVSNKYKIYNLSLTYLFKHPFDIKFTYLHIYIFFYILTILFFTYLQLYLHIYIQHVYSSCVYE